MNILQSTVERLLYYLLALVFIAIIVVGFFAYQDGQQIKHLVMVQLQQTKSIETNQYLNGKAFETFVRNGLICTATLPLIPNPTSASINAEGNKCFPDTTEIK